MQWNFKIKLKTCKTFPINGRLSSVPGTGEGHWSISWQAVIKQAYDTFKELYTLYKNLAKFIFTLLII